MSVTKNITSLKLYLEAEDGVNALGAMQTKSALISSVVIDAENAKCYAVAEAIGELMAHPVVNVYVSEKAALEKAE